MVLRTSTAQSKDLIGTLKWKPIEIEVARAALLEQIDDDDDD